MPFLIKGLRVITVAMSAALLLFSCGKKKSDNSDIKMAGGLAQISRPSYIFPLNYENPTTKSRGNCSITFISEHFFMTAAHCLWEQNHLTKTLAKRNLLIRGKFASGVEYYRQIQHSQMCFNSHFEDNVLKDGYLASPYDIAIGFTGSLTSLSELDHEAKQNGESSSNIPVCNKPRTNSNKKVLTKLLSSPGEEDQASEEEFCKPQIPTSADITPCHVRNLDFSFDQVPGQKYANFADWGRGFRCSQNDGTVKDSSYEINDAAISSTRYNGGVQEPYPNDKDGNSVAFATKNLVISGFTSGNADVSYNTPFVYGPGVIIPTEGIFSSAGILVSQVADASSTTENTAAHLTGGDSGAPILRCQGDDSNPCKSFDEIIGINSIYMSGPSDKSLTPNKAAGSKYLFNIFVDASAHIGKMLRLKTLVVFRDTLDDYHQLAQMSGIDHVGPDISADILSRMRKKGFGACEDTSYALVSGYNYYDTAGMNYYNDFSRFNRFVENLEDLDWAGGGRYSVSNTPVSEPKLVSTNLSKPTVTMAELLPNNEHLNTTNIQLDANNECVVSLLANAGAKFLALPLHCVHNGGALPTADLQAKVSAFKEKWCLSGSSLVADLDIVCDASAPLYQGDYANDPSITEKDIMFIRVTSSKPGISLLTARDSEMEKEFRFFNVKTGKYGRHLFYSSNISQPEGLGGVISSCDGSEALSCVHNFDTKEGDSGSIIGFVDAQKQLKAFCMHKGGNNRSNYCVNIYAALSKYGTPQQQVQVKAAKTTAPAIVVEEAVAPPPAAPDVLATLLSLCRSTDGESVSKVPANSRAANFICYSPSRDTGCEAYATTFSRFSDAAASGAAVGVTELPKSKDSKTVLLVADMLTTVNPNPDMRVWACVKMSDTQVGWVWVGSDTAAVETYLNQ